METVIQGHEAVGVERIGKVLMHAKDLALIVEDQLQALHECHDAQEVVGRAISVLHVLVEQLDSGLQEAHKLS